MSNNIRVPGFPPPEKQDIVQFYILKSLSYSTRMMLYLILILVGFLIQLLTLSRWPGAIFLVFATLLNLVRGYDSRARLKSFFTDGKWTEVDIDRIHQIVQLDVKISKWDKDILDISNPSGMFAFILILVGLFIGSSFLTAISQSVIIGIITIDIIILILPLWFNGIRRILKQNNLRIKVDIIIFLEAFFKKTRKNGENFKPALMLAKDKSGKSLPTDSRFTIAFDGMPADFYGIQAQININLVQGTSYPYFYCVIPAKPGFGLKEYLSKLYKAKNVTIEFQEDQNAEVIVIRQYTTKTSGYHTKTKDCRQILELALVNARLILGSQSNNTEDNI